MYLFCYLLIIMKKGRFILVCLLFVTVALWEFGQKEEKIKRQKQYQT